MFGERLKQLRQNTNKNQHELAATFRISRSTLAAWELGDREPDFETLVKMSRHFRVTTDYLLGLSDIPFSPYVMSDDEVEYIDRTLEVYRDIKHNFNVNKKASD